MSWALWGICARFFCVRTARADLELNKRASGPTPKELARIPRRICVASGTHRVRALRGALRTGAITDLVLDDALAKALMEK